MKKITICFLVLLWGSLTSEAQVAEKVVENFKNLKSISYQSAVRNKDFFSDVVYSDTIFSLISLEKLQPKSFKINGLQQSDWFNGINLFRLNPKDSTYRISEGMDKSLNFYKSLPYYITMLEKSLKENRLIKQLPDSTVNGISYYHLSVINLDSIKYNQRIFDTSSILIDQKNYFPYYYKNEIQGFVDGTNMFVSTFFEYYFSAYQLNDPSFPDLSMIELPYHYTLEKPEKAIPLLKTGTKAPDFKLRSVNGKEFHLAKEKGKIILLNFTMNGCPHCVESIETLNRVFSKYNRDKLLLVGINGYDTEEAIQKFNTKYQVQYPTFHIAGDSQKIIKDYCVTAYPTFYLIDQKGTIAQRFSGFHSGLEKELTNAIDKLIKPTNAAPLQDR